MTWTASDKLQLRGMIQSGKRYAEIARTLDRPYQTVVSQAGQMRVRRLSSEQLRRLWSCTWPDMAFEDDPRAPEREPVFTMPRPSQGMPTVSSMADVVVA